MKRISNLKASAALGSLTAVVALLGGLSTASAQDASPVPTPAPGAGSFPRSWLVPGTNTSVRFGGYAKLDYVYDIGPFQEVDGGMDWAALPIEGPTSKGGPGYPNPAYAKRGATELTASESRFNLETRTPTAYGEFKTMIEGDFIDPSGLSPGPSQSGLMVNSNSYGFRLRTAYGTLGPWMMGQNFSTFEDLSSQPETLDFGGPAGLAGVLRQPQIRYTYAAGNGFTWAFGLENPQSTWETPGTISSATSTGTTTALGTGGISHFPDLASQARLDGAWGHVSLHMLLREIRVDNGGVSPKATSAGGGGGVSGQLNTWGKDNFQWDIEAGTGLGRYILDDNPPDAAYNSANGAFQLLTVWSATAAYQHWWTDKLRSTVTAGYVHISSGESVLGSTYIFQTKDYSSQHINLVWSPVPFVDTGIEFMHGYREVYGGASGDFERLQYSTKFRF